MNLRDDLRVYRRRRSQVIEAIAVEVPLLVELFEPLRKLLESLRLVVIPRDVSKGLREATKNVFAYPAGTGVAADRLRYRVLKGGVAHFAARETDNGEAVQRLARDQFI